MNLSSRPFASTLRHVLGASCLVAATLPGLAAGQGEPPNGAPPAPPPEAYEACRGQTQGTACTVTFHEHSIHGTCAAAADNATLFCRPSAPPGPPPEAFTACEGHAEGAACTVSFHGGTLDGTCATFPDRGLVCRPSRFPDAPR